MIGHAKLHELAASERFDIFCRQLEPFTVTTLSLEPFVPVCIDTYWVIGLDNMNGICFLWKLDCQFSLSSPDRICLSNLVVTSKLHEVYKADNLLVGRLSVGLR